MSAVTMSASAMPLSLLPAFLAGPLPPPTQSAFRRPSISFHRLDPLLAEALSSSSLAPPPRSSSRSVVGGRPAKAPLSLRGRILPLEKSWSAAHHG